MRGCLDSVIYHIQTGFNFVQPYFFGTDFNVTYMLFTITLLFLIRMVLRIICYIYNKLIHYDILLPHRSGEGILAAMFTASVNILFLIIYAVVAFLLVSTLHRVWVSSTGLIHFSVIVSTFVLVFAIFCCPLFLELLIGEAYKVGMLRFFRAPLGV